MGVAGRQAHVLLMSFFSLPSSSRRLPAGGKVRNLMYHRPLPFSEPPAPPPPRHPRRKKPRPNTPDVLDNAARGELPFLLPVILYAFFPACHARVPRFLPRAFRAARCRCRPRRPRHALYGARTEISVAADEASSFPSKKRGSEVASRKEAPSDRLLFRAATVKAYARRQASAVAQSAARQVLGVCVCYPGEAGAR